MKSAISCPMIFDDCRSKQVEELLVEEKPAKSE